MSEEFDIEKLLKKHLSNEKEPIGANLFDQIEGKIIENKKEGRRWLFYIWGGIIGLSSLLITFFVFGHSITLNEKTNHSFKAKAALDTNGFFQLDRYTPTSNLFENTSVNLTKSDTDMHFRINSKSLLHSKRTNSGNDNTQNPEAIGTSLFDTTPAFENDLTATNPHTSTTMSMTNLTADSTNRDLQLLSTLESKVVPQEHKERSPKKTAVDETKYLNLPHHSDTSSLETPGEKDTFPNDQITAQRMDSTEVLTDRTTTLTNPILNVNDTNSTRTVNQQNTTAPVDDTTTQNLSNNDTVRDTMDSADEPKTSTYSIGLHGGPTAFDISLFRPYFSSGALSKYDFESSGFEFGVGIYRKLGKRFQINLSGIYMQYESGFNYDLAISEEDYFNLYKQNKLIPVENLNSPNSCNCFFAEGASLDYTLKNIALSIGIDYQFLDQEKHTAGVGLMYSGVSSFRFANTGSSVVEFPNESNELFNISQFRVGFNYFYHIHSNIQLGLQPTYGVIFGKKSSTLSESAFQLTIPVGVRINF